MASPLGAGNIVVSVIFPLAAIVFLALRLRSRHTNVRSWFIDDYMIVIALLSLVSYAVITILAVAIYSLGTSSLFISFDDLVGILKLEYADELVMIVLSTFTMLSIVYLYRRVLPPYRKSVPTTTLLVLVYAWGVAYLATSLFSCIPISKRWNPLNGGYCYSTNQVNEAFDISDLVINIIILVRPITRMREFRSFTARMKGLIGGIISLGIIIIIIIIIRIAMSSYSSGSVDISYDLAKLSLLAQLEASLFVIYACLLSLVSSHPVNSVEEIQEAGPYEKPELAAEDIPRQIRELDSTNIVELPVPTPELMGTIQYHQLQDTSATGSRERV
ncbi:hypothetical protein F5B22DRAFT_594992 [Xylaria bambusicola]|uniref:uncharacterized protein n=1 Tax=Xylaria bambusicola TaxID=326684 RepID=UPI0020074D68|nr:uncharacterized protein F5B22DRAFT_594992 [Xylaria bambusicola]KAI0522012.1 hypothetical protein F5B22DRAFT_594992 [Xylaria bambusicola]